MSLKKSIYEHLKTHKKYNTLEIEYNCLKKMYEDKVLEYEQLKNQQKVIKEVWEKRLMEQEEKIIELRKRKAKKKEIE